jgi:3-hexulose-6-phosphate synthase
MKLQISYNFTDLNQALDVARKTVNHADILEVGSLLIYKEGINAIKQFKINFPQKPIFADVKISENVQSAIGLLAQAGANIISILAGIPYNTIKKAADEAKKLGLSLALDVIDTPDASQISLDAKQLGIDIILVHQPSVETDPVEFASQIQSIQANTKIPLFITGRIDRDNIQQIISLKPQGIAIGSAIIKADNPYQEALYFKSLLP